MEIKNNTDMCEKYTNNKENKINNQDKKININSASDDKIETNNFDRVEATRSTTEVSISNLLSNLPSTLPTLEYDFNPPIPRRKYFVPTLSNRLLTRRIYLEMLKVIRAYGELERIAPVEDQPTIQNLRNQMEILSLAMLNIYGKTTDSNRVPFFAGGGINLSKDYNKALFQIYDRVYHIHNLVFSLIAKTTDDSIKSTLVIIYTNLKSQLQTLFDLRS